MNCIVVTRLGPLSAGFGGGAFFQPFLVGLEGRPFLLALGQAFPLQQVIKIVVGGTDFDRPEAGLADAVAIP